MKKIPESVRTFLMLSSYEEIKSEALNKEEIPVVKQRKYQGVFYLLAISLVGNVFAYFLGFLEGNDIAWGVIPYLILGALSLWGHRLFILLSVFVYSVDQIYGKYEVCFAPDSEIRCGVATLMSTIVFWLIVVRPLIEAYEVELIKSQKK